MRKPVASKHYHDLRRWGKVRRRTVVLAMLLAGDVTMHLMHMDANLRIMKAQAGRHREHTGSDDGAWDTRGSKSSMCKHEKFHPRDFQTVASRARLQNGRLKEIYVMDIAAG